MAKNTKIEWAHHTFNPWVGCTKVSPACDHCYAEGWAKRSGMVKWGADADRRRTSENNWKQPLKWNAEAKRLGVRYRVFCASLSDVFDKAVPTEWRTDLLDMIVETPHLDWLLLTKRIGNAHQMLIDATNHAAGWTAFPNVWVGATICNQEEADRDIPKLLAVPAAKRFLSVEPLLSEINLVTVQHGARVLDVLNGGGVHETHFESLPSNHHPTVDWVIVGGESGHGARPMHPYWVRSLRDQCIAAEVPFLFKQWGEWASRSDCVDLFEDGNSFLLKQLGEWIPRNSCVHMFEDDNSCAEIDPSATKWPSIRIEENGQDGHHLENENRGDSVYMQRVGKKLAGRSLDGFLWDEVPEVET